MINYPIQLDPPGKQLRGWAFIPGFAGSLCESSSCPGCCLLTSRKGLVGSKLLPALHLHQPGQGLRGGQVNAGSWQLSWLFLWLVSTGTTSCTGPGSPSLRSCPWDHSPFGSHLDFTALLPPSRLSDPACLSYHFPVLTKVLGMEKAAGRGGFLPLRLLLGCCARKVPLGRLLQTNAAPNTQLAHALSHLCYLYPPNPDPFCDPG